MAQLWIVRQHERSQLMKRCSYCGAEYPDDAVVCSVDRTSLDSPPRLSFRWSSLLIFGAWVCLLLGIYIAGVVVVIFATDHIQTYSTADAFAFSAFIVYPFVAFVPFFALVYPRLKSLRKPALFSIALLEMLVVGLFLWPILFPHL